MVERLTRNEQVRGSIPRGGSIGMRDNEQVVGSSPTGGSVQKQAVE